MKLLTKYWLVIFFALGILFRLWLVQMLPQPYGGDQEEYHQAALGILSDKSHIYTAQYRPSGYPMFLALNYFVFGSGDKFFWILSQAILDTLTAFIVYSLAKQILPEKRGAKVSFLLYLFNPFTSGYVGVKLSEVVAIFILSLTIWLLVAVKKGKSSYLPILAFVSSLLPQVRPGFIFLSLIIYLFGFYLLLKEKLTGKIKIVYAIFSLIVFLLPFLYNVTANIKYYRRFSFMTIDNLTIRELYLSLYIKQYDTMKGFPDQAHWVYQQFTAARTDEERKMVREKFAKLSLEKIKADPWDFVKTRIEKMWLVWEKHYLFPFNNPGGSLQPAAVYLTNLVVLAGSVAGLAILLVKKIARERWFIFLSLLIFAYISTVHTITVTAERFSLPAYPLVFLFAGYGVFMARESFFRRRSATARVAKITKRISKVFKILFDIV